MLTINWNYRANKRWKLVNYTKFDEALIREIVRFVKPSGLSGFELRIHNSWAWHGRAYGSKLAKVYVKKGVTEQTRYTRPSHHKNGERKRGYINSTQFTPTEDMVHLIAHELRHLWQPRNRNRRSVWGARNGRYSERDADSYAIKMVRAWRREHGLAEPKRVEPIVKPVPTRNQIREKKLDALRLREKRWVTRSRRAATALKKVRRSIKWHEKQLANGSGGSSIGRTIVA